MQEERNWSENNAIIGTNHITQPEWHSAEGISTERTGKGSFLLVVERHLYLVVDGISIEKTVEEMSCDSLQDLVDEW